MQLDKILQKKKNYITCLLKSDASSTKSGQYKRLKNPTILINHGNPKTWASSPPNIGPERRWTLIRKYNMKVMAISNFDL